MAFRRATLVTGLSLAFATTAMAEGPRISGVVEVEGLGAGLDAIFSIGGTDYPYSGTQRAAYGSSRLGLDLAPNLSGQLDGWISYGDYD